jgi:hypothetical protein
VRWDKSNGLEEWKIVSVLLINRMKLLADDAEASVMWIVYHYLKKSDRVLTMSVRPKIPPMTLFETPNVFRTIKTHHGRNDFDFLMIIFRSDSIPDVL